MSRFTEKLRSRPGLAALGAIVLVSAGGAIAAVSADCDRPEAMAPAAPVRIGSLATAGDSLVTVRGRIVQMFGRHAVLNDGSGQILVDMGHGAEGAPALAVGQVIAAQGRYDNGMLRARHLVGPDGTVTALGRGGHRGDRHGRRGGDETAERVEAAPAAPATASATTNQAAAVR